MSILARRMQLQMSIRGAGPQLSEGSVTRETNFQLRQIKQLVNLNLKEKPK